MNALSRRVRYRARSVLVALLPVPPEPLRAGIRDTAAVSREFWPQTRRAMAVEVRGVASIRHNRLHVLRNKGLGLGAKLVLFVGGLGLAYLVMLTVHGSSVSRSADCSSSVRGLNGLTSQLVCNSLMPVYLGVFAEKTPAGGLSWGLCAS